MKLKVKLLFLTTLFVLAIPLVFSVNAGAAVFNTDGATHNAAGGWDLPAVAGTGFNNCLYCHQGTIASDKSSYLLGGHKNMSRPADGLPWGMPGVDAAHPFLGDSTVAGINSLGIFTELWIKEDYPRMPVDWTAKTIFQGYCGNADGTTNSSSLPNLLLCPTCETPVFGDGAAGYPLNYPDSTTCTAAGFTWFGPTTKPLYWIYGGAGLEGGPPMYEPGAQNYKCGRCHTTGYTADTSAKTTKHPYDLNASMNTVPVVGSTTLLLNPSKSGYTLSSWDQWGIQCSRCHVGAVDGNHSNSVATDFRTGGDIVALCMNCHRQESDATPRSAVGTVVVNPATGATNTTVLNMAPYTNKQQQPDGFAHHPDGNEFLNSPHSRFTGTFGQIGCPPYAIDGYTTITPGTPGAPTDCTPGTMNLDGSTSSLYASKFAQAAKVDLTVISDSAAGSCATCHDVHQPLNNNTAGMSKSVKTVCTDCHSSSTATISPQVNLSFIKHPTTAGTPLDVAEPSEACVICHQPAGVAHLWRINTDANYTMYGDYTHVDPPSGNVVPSHMAPDSTGYSAMWVDLDNACGQCHGGGASETDVTTTGSITAGTAPGNYTLTVANATGFASSKEVTIAGAGVGGGPHKTIIASVSGNTVYLTYKASTTVSNAVVTVAGNPTSNGAGYFTKAVLSLRAQCIHSDATGANATIHATAGTGGSISPAGTVWVSNGSSQTYTITPNAEYQVARLIVDGASVSPATSYTFTNVSGCHTISAYFEQVVFTITATSDANGNINPLGTVSVNSGDSGTFTITPNAGYQVSNVTVDGWGVGAVTSYTFTNVKANHTINASFKTATYTITATAGTGGSISPAGTSTYLYGTDRTYTITPATGYHIADVLVDGTSVGAVQSYPFSNITANHTISASFAANPSYTITASAGSNGSISPSGSVSVTGGTNKTFTMTPTAGYRVQSVLVDGASVGSSSIYNFTNVTADHTISVSFEPDVFTISAIAYAGGSITPAGDTAVARGGSQTYTITPDPGYIVKYVVLDSTSLGAVTSYTVTNVKTNHTIKAYFKVAP